MCHTYHWALSLSTSTLYVIALFRLGHGWHLERGKQERPCRQLIIRRSVFFEGKRGWDVMQQVPGRPCQSLAPSSHPFLHCASSWLDSLFCLRCKLISSSLSEACWAFMCRGTGRMAEAISDPCSLPPLFVMLASRTFILLLSFVSLTICDWLCSAIVWPLILIFQWQGQSPFDN